MTLEDGSSKYNDVRVSYPFICIEAEHFIGMTVAKRIGRALSLTTDVNECSNIDWIVNLADVASIAPLLNMVDYVYGLSASN